jgi:hypothetical protein
MRTAIVRATVATYAAITKKRTAAVRLSMILKDKHPAVASPGDLLGTNEVSLGLGRSTGRTVAPGRARIPLFEAVRPSFGARRARTVSLPADR